MQERDPFAIPDGATIGDTYVVPFMHPKKEDAVITIYLMEDEQGEMARFVTTEDARLLTRKSRETAKDMFATLKPYRFPYIGNKRMLRYDDVRAAIAAAYRPIPDKDLPAS